MLTLIIEWRFWARDVGKMKRSRFRESRKLRSTLVAVNVATCALMLAGFFAALGGIRSGSASPLRDGLVALGLGSGVGAVFLSPALTLSSVLIGDVLLEWRRKAPWSPVQRGIRRHNGLTDSFMSQVRERRAERLVHWMGAAQSLIDLGTEVPVNEPLTHRRRQALAVYVAEWNTWCDEMVSLREEKEEIERLWFRLSDDIRAAQKVDDGEIKRLRKLIQSTAR